MSAGIERLLWTAFFLGAFFVLASVTALAWEWWRNRVEDARHPGAHRVNDAETALLPRIADGGEAP